MIILNKVSLVDVAELQRVEGIVRGLNPTARVLQTDFGRVLPSDVLCTDLFDFDTAEECAGIFFNAKSTMALFLAAGRTV